MEMMPVSANNLPVGPDTKALSGASLSAAFRKTTVEIVVKPDGGMFAVRIQQFSANYSDVREMPDGLGAQNYAAGFEDPSPQPPKKTAMEVFEDIMQEDVHERILGYKGNFDPRKKPREKKQKTYAEEMKAWKERQNLKSPKAKAPKAKI